MSSVNDWLSTLSLSRNYEELFEEHEYDELPMIKGMQQKQVENMIDVIGCQASDGKKILNNLFPTDETYIEERDDGNFSANPSLDQLPTVDVQAHGEDWERPHDLPDLGEKFGYSVGRARLEIEQGKKKTPEKFCIKSKNQKLYYTLIVTYPNKRQSAPIGRTVNAKQRNWSAGMDGVKEWLEELGMSKHEDNFDENEYDTMEMIMELNEKNLNEMINTLQLNGDEAQKVRSSLQDWDEGQKKVYNWLKGIGLGDKAADFINQGFDDLEEIKNMNSNQVKHMIDSVPGVSLDHFRTISDAIDKSSESINVYNAHLESSYINKGNDPFQQEDWEQALNDEIKRLQINIDQCKRNIEHFNKEITATIFGSKNWDNSEEKVRDEKVLMNYYEHLVKKKKNIRHIGKDRKGKSRALKPSEKKFVKDFNLKEKSTHWVIEKHMDNDQVEVLNNLLDSKILIMTLEATDVGINDKAINILSEYLKTNSVLTSLNLGENVIGNAGCEYLEAILSSNGTIHTLLLHENYIGEDGVEFICKGLRNNNSLHTLNLSSNKVGTRGAINLASVLETNSTITNLQLAENYIEDLGAEAFAGMLMDNQCLVALNLKGNKITSYGAKTLVKGMEENTSVSKRCLELGQNPIHPSNKKNFYKNCPYIQFTGTKIKE